MDENRTSRAPDFDLSALDKDTEIRGNIGCAWSNPDGTISIKLNPFLVLDSGTQRLVVTLFPRNNRRGKS